MAPSSSLQKCPYCLSEIPAEAKKCRHCGEWVNNRIPSDSTNPTPPAAPDNQVLNPLPIFQHPAKSETVLNVSFKKRKVQGISGYGQWRGKGSIAFSNEGITITGRHVKSFGKRMGWTFGITAIAMIISGGLLAPSFIIFYLLFEFVILDSEVIDFSSNNIVHWATSNGNFAVAITDFGNKNPVVFVPDDLNQAETTFKLFSTNAQI